MRSHVVRRAALAVAVSAASLAVPGLPARAQDASPRTSHRDRTLAYDEQVEDGRSSSLQRQRRYAQDRYRQDYRDRLQERRRERSVWRLDDDAGNAYLDAPASVRYTYDGQSFAPPQHAHYLREGVRRGYEDGVNDSRHYGRTEDGHYLLLSTVLADLLTFETLR